ncbi:MAG TPA: glycosyltransferase [Thermoanaerobaculia bacterium]|nr:glycosyltransferase [Thermoanaerobaculia bacterium]
MTPRAAFFVPSLRGGGAERVTVLLAAAVAARGVTADLVLAQAVGPYLATVPEGVRVVDLAARRVVAALPALTRYLRRERPEVLMATLANANVVAALARRRSGVPMRLVLREGSPIRQMAGRSGRLRGLVMPTFVRRFYPLADLLLANAQSIADELAQELGGEGPPIRVLANPIEPERLRAAAAALDAADLPVGSGPLFVAAGRLTEQKDFPTLLEALALLRRRGMSARLVILGEGPDRRLLEALVERRGLGGAVRLPGFRDALPAFLARAQGFVLPSRWEGQPNVLLEALALGCSPVATDCPGASAEILAGGRFGRLVPMEDPERLATAMAETVERPFDAADLAARAEEFSVARLLPRYLGALGLGGGEAGP